MGIDLTLLPLDFDGALKFSHTVLQVRRDYRLWERIEALGPQELPADHDVSGYGAVVPDGSMKDERCYGTLIADAYGDRYTLVTAAQLLTAFDKHTGPAWTVAYIRALPPETRIILDWH